MEGPTAASACRESRGGDGDPDLYRVVGIVERVTFHDPRSGRAVLRVRAVDHPRPIAVVATFLDTDAGVVAGARIEADGLWSRHPRYGMQFTVHRARIGAPAFAGALERFLAGGRVAGVGPVHARRLIESFGPQVLEIAEREPWRLREVVGVGPRRAAALCDAALETAPVTGPPNATAGRVRPIGGRAGRSGG